MLARRRAFLYVLDGLADWQTSLLVAELNGGGLVGRTEHRRRVTTVGASTDCVTTLGGLTLLPEDDAAAVTMRTCAVLILPGADTWLRPRHRPVLERAARLVAAGVPVAAIGSAVVGLASVGALDGRSHTANSFDQLAEIPAYLGADRYRSLPVVRDRNLVTAMSAAPVHFAREVLALLGAMAPETLEQWFRLFRTEDAGQVGAVLGTRAGRTGRQVGV